ncbi:TadE/TadG family type IV pilus assembly protein [Streptomyces sp. NPDC058251]|uniref:TadE/TadG family type IV pilus assembly protein n=1 Tax=Streptomyces sp. NPDC058251 TaxID=3346404 RepID=UPI0036E75476
MRTLLKRGVRDSSGVRDARRLRDARGLRETRSLRDSGGLSDSRGLRDIRSLRDDRGVSILEFAGFLPILLVIGMAAIQLGLIGYGINQAGTGARAAARVASQGGDGAAAGQAAVSGWLSPDVSAPEGPDVTTATVTVTVPNVIPLFADVTVVRHATMPTDD